MPGRFLLDTNIVIALFAKDPGVQSRLASATEVFVPSIAIGELYYGARKSARPEPNALRVQQFAKSNSILPCDLDTAWHYAQIKDTLRLKGLPIPENDLWIAAVASQHELTLVSRDDHFRHIGGLSLESW
jgi:tRNA(fMet)-specific endonuclease VapC